jgi:hypothetical protein
MGLDEVRKAGRQHRSRKVEALAGVAAKPGDVMVLLNDLDTVGHDGHSEAVSKSGNGRHDGSRRGVAVQRGNDVSVQLHNVQWVALHLSK